MAEPVISTSKLRWATVTAGGVEVVEPDNTHKDNGWTSAEEPPHTFFNYWMNVVYLWLVYLDGLPAEAMTWTAAHIFQAGITVTSAGTSVTATGAAGQFYGVRGIAAGNGAAGNPNAGVKGEAAAGTNSAGVRGDATGLATRFAGWFKAAAGAKALHAEGGLAEFTAAENSTAVTIVGGYGGDNGGGGPNGPGGTGMTVNGGSTPSGPGGSFAGGVALIATGGDGDDGNDAIQATGGGGGFSSGWGGRFTGGGDGGGGAGGGLWAKGGQDFGGGAGVGFHVEGGAVSGGGYASAIVAQHGLTELQDGLTVTGTTLLSGICAVTGVLTATSIFAEAAIGITLVNGWANVGGAAQVAQYWIDRTGYVWLRGLITGAAATNATLFTLPVGYRPAATQYFDVMEGVNGTINRITINTAGVVAYAGTLALGGSNISLNALRFRV